MRIKSIYVNNFKSLVDFKIDLAKFNCLIGLNGSGKSTFLQFMSFLVQLMKGNTGRWSEKMGWPAPLIMPRYFFPTVKKGVRTESVQNINLVFKVEIVDDATGSSGFWEGEFVTRYEFVFVAETISYNGYTLRTKATDKEAKNGLSRFVCSFTEEKSGTDLLKENLVVLPYDSSILSKIDAPEILDHLKPIKNFICNIDVCEQFSVVDLKSFSRKSGNTVGLRGESTGAFMRMLGEEKLAKISKKLLPYFPFLDYVGVDSRHFEDEMWCIGVKEKYPGTASYSGNISFLDATQINDGMLRLIAFLVQLESSKKLLLFDEIENGINPELVGFLTKELIDAKQQIVVTTHSPLFLNYLDDETAIPGVHFIYKTPEGATRTVPFLSIPEMKEKLEMMGPGEAFIDTNLVELSRRLSETGKEA